MKITQIIDRELKEENKLFMYQLYTKLSSIAETIPQYINNMDRVTFDKYLYYQWLFNRRINSMVEDILGNDDVLSEAKMQDLMLIIYRKNSEKWSRDYRALTENYNPIENYSMSQTTTPNLTTSNTGASKTRLETNITNKVNSINSISPVQTTGSNTIQSGDVNNNEVSNTETRTGSETMVRSGNIGVTTSAQMIKGEIDTRNMYNFWEILCKDIMKELCLLII